MSKSGTALFLGVIGIGLAGGAAAHGQWKTHWSYSGPAGPAHWGDLDPAYAACKLGREQSPVDIRDAKAAALPPLRFAYKSGPVRIINNGYTAVRVDYGGGNGNFLLVGNKRYELTQFHFHHPSEERLNGKSYPMALHLMHRAADGQVAGVTVFLQTGASNPVIHQLWQYMPQTAGPGATVAGLAVDPARLLPQNRAYYAYMGSVTAPPCTEGVAWFVLKTPMTVSAAEIKAFARLYPHDVRPIQPLNGRTITASR